MVIERIELNVNGIIKWHLIVDGVGRGYFDLLSNCNERIEHFKKTKCRKGEKVTIKEINLEEEQFNE